MSSLDLVAAGGNQHPSAADWNFGILAFGAGKNLAIWHLDKSNSYGLSHLLSGHTDDITAVKLVDRKGQKKTITGSADKTILIWAWDGKIDAHLPIQSLTNHAGSVNTIAVLEDDDIFASGSADGTVKVWRTSSETADLEQTITLKPRYLPLSCALAKLDDGTIVLAVAGTSREIQLYARMPSSASFELQATLSGHEGWIRSLDFTNDKASGDLMLASASQDKYTRLWRFSRSSASTGNGTLDETLVEPKKSLSNKAHQVGSAEHKYAVTFEALLIGHEDWIYTARWVPPLAEGGLRLLTSSADNSLAIWKADESSGVWICQTRLGEISSQKGSTTATGSTGGFWIGLWQPDGSGVATLGRTGSWRKWRHDAATDIWLQQPSISGHVKEVQGIAWALDGSYLLSTSSDQTTRVWAEWKKQDGSCSWHEFARPQIHGYDLNCVASLTANQFISGADEKLLRVFNKPKAIDELLSKLCGLQASVDDKLPDAANIPVLGLSNKAVAAAPDDEPVDVPTTNGDDSDAVDATAVVHKSTLDLDHPPFEDHLARHTLWPEHEKLYGHGYEISAVAASADGSIVATACKASSIDHAVIRLYDCQEWREVKPPLKAHSLTVTALAFSPDSQWLLSVGRDRQWAVFKRGEPANNAFELFQTNPKGHARMILDCSWASSEVGVVFATAGRDKTVKLWKVRGEEVQLMTTITASAAVTAVEIGSTVSDNTTRLAYGTEDGKIGIVALALDTLEAVTDTPLPASTLPSAAINALRWRPRSRPHKTGHEQLAVASDDGSVRVINVAQEEKDGMAG